MLELLFYEVAPDYLECRPLYRDEHLALADPVDSAVVGDAATSPVRPATAGATGGPS